MKRFAPLCLILVVSCQAFADDSLNVSLISQRYQYFDNVNDACIDGSFLYLTTENTGLRIFDISDPDNPVETGYWPTPDRSFAVTVADGYAYLMVRDHGMQIVDVSDPSSPVHAGSYNPDGPSVGSVAVAGDVAYVTRCGDGMRVLDISDRGNPVEIGSIEGELYWVRIVYANETVYCYDNLFDNIRVIDVSEPSQPDTVTVIEAETWEFQVNDVALYAIYSDEFEVYDIQVPHNPQYVSTVTGIEPTWFTELSVNQMILLEFNILTIFGLDDPLAPVELGSYELATGENSATAIAGDLAMVASYDEFKLFDIEDPSSINLVVNYAPRGPVYDVAVDGDLACVSLHYGGLDLLDVSDPSDPLLLTTIDDGQTVYTVHLASNRLYYIDYHSGSYGFHSVDVSNPLAPVELGSLDIPTHIRDFDIAGDYAYLTDWGDMVRVLDISDPSAPVEIGLGDSHGYAGDIEVHGDYAYATEFWTGLRVFDIADPTMPTEIGSFQIDHTDGLACGLTVDGNWVYMANGYGGLRILDVSDPTDPAELVHLDSDESEDVFEVVVRDGFAFVADMKSGLLVYDVHNPADPELTGFYGGFGRGYDIALQGGHAFFAANECLQILDVNLAVEVNELDPDSPILPDEYALSAPWPNPFNSNASFTVSLPVSARLTVQVYNVTGQQIAILANEIYNPGLYSLTLDGFNLASGMYFIRTTVPGHIEQVQKVMLIR